MTIYLYLATSAGLFIAAQTNGEWRIGGQALTEHSLTSVVVSEGIILAGTVDGIWRSYDKGKSWNKADKHLTIPYVRWLAGSSNAPKIILAGTEPASIFVSHDGANSWHTSPEVAELRDNYGWFLPYSPNAGCVRGFAVAESGPQPARVYAAVEVGGVLVSNDNGNTWHLAEGSDGRPDMDRFAQIENDLLAVLSNGELWSKQLSGSKWHRVLPEITHVKAIAANN
ncbi:MAG: WD40/YVTN/BNR-like repeat-containing protein [Planctomycetota bacterium]|jgi:photosystem II stability/assembly factor-like uncharacterized protein